MKKILTLAFFASLSFGLFSQSKLQKGTAKRPSKGYSIEKQHSCSFDQINTSSWNSSKMGMSLSESMEKSSEIFRNSSKTNYRSVREIPVIFHLVLTNSHQNQMPDYIFQNIIDEMNERYQLQNTDQSNVRNQFSPANPQIKFCLAKQDENGNSISSPGVNRKIVNDDFFDINSTHPQLSYDSERVKFDQYGGVDQWDYRKYINIWVCDINGNGNSQYVTGGYSFAPQLAMSVNQFNQGLHANGIDRDGIVMDYLYGLSDALTLTHEVGHYLGLFHPWGAQGGCNDDDGFTDTPNTENAAFSYNSTGCNNPNLSTCNGELVQYENYMDYSECQSMFTQEQADYMNAIIDKFRLSLTTSDVCNVVDQNAPPVASFSASPTTVNVNTTVSFSDASTNSPTSWQWSISPNTFNFVNNTTNTSQNPQVQFTDAGTYTVTLTVNNGNGSDTETKTNYITVNNAPPTTGCIDLDQFDLTMGFEDSDNLNEWSVINANNDQFTYQGNSFENTWEVFDNNDGNGVGASSNSGYNYLIYFYNTSDNTMGGDDYVISQCFTAKTGAEYNLSYYYRAGLANYEEKMEVLLMDENLNVVKQLNDYTNVNNEAYQKGEDSFNVTNSGNYRVAFRVYSDPDKYFLLLDDINLTKQESTLSVSENNSLKFTLYPNPAKNEVNIIRDSGLENVEYTIFNIDGKVVSKGQLSSQETSVDLSELKSGLYNIKLKSDYKESIQKFIKY